MSEYIRSEYKLLIKGRRLSHIWFMTFPDNIKSPIIITDGALNISPNVETKKHIINNVIEFISKLPNFYPKIAILSATEEILPQMQSSVDAKDLVEWSRIEHPTVDIQGPFAFDNAISSDSAKIKGISNSVAGNANVILVPNVETGNSLVKIMVNFMNCTAGGFVTGGISPVVITSRSDSSSSRLSSIVNAVLSAL
jgi:phosphate acetyltransferase